MKVKTAALIVALGLLAAPLPGEAQRAVKVYRIAIFGPSMLSELLPAQIWRSDTLELQLTLGGAICSPERMVPRRMADTIGGGLCQGLRELGRELGNFKVLYAFEGALRRPSYLAAELVRSKVDIILAAGTRAALAAKEATRSIPVVFVEVPDPVAAGLVGSLARPGANITGVSSMLVELGGKQLELLKEAIPNVSRVAVLHDPTDTAAVLKEMQVTALALGLTLQSVEVQDPGDFEPVVSAITRGRANAVLVIPGHSLWLYKSWIVDVVRQSHLPAMLWSREFVDLGGLMAYGPDLPDVGRRAASMVDRILRGANPVDIPVERPTRYQLTINLKTAKALGLTIPPTLLFRADRVIK
ncbi:MAG: ABC transporter substrate-binding protein [Terriglobia bacterium]